VHVGRFALKCNLRHARSTKVFSARCAGGKLNFPLNGPCPGKRANRPYEVLELDLSGFPTNQDLTLQVSASSVARSHREPVFGKILTFLLEHWIHHNAREEKRMGDVIAN